MNKLYPITLMVLLLLAGLSACSSKEEVEPTPVEEGMTLIEMNPEESRSISQQNTFGFKVLANMTDEENCVISPVSLSLGLSMVANGADGQTRKEILDALGVADLEQLNAVNGKLLSSLPKVDPSKVEIAFGNAMYADPSLNVFESYKSTLLDTYQAEVVTTSSNNIREKVNEFVSLKTRGHITEAMPGISGDVSMALVNALYFKGAWAREFDKDATAKGKFHNLDGTVSEVDMMKMEIHQWNPTMIIEKINGAKLVVGINLEFGNGAYSISFIEPDPNFSTIEEYLDKLIAGNVITQDIGVLTCLKIPKLVIDTQLECCKALQSMGIEKVFNQNEADLSHLSPVNGISLSNVFQSSKFEVSEEGAVGQASAEYVGMAGGYHPDGLNYILENPFIFYITEKSSGAVVFAGKVTKL